MCRFWWIDRLSNRVRDGCTRLPCVFVSMDPTGDIYRAPPFFSSAYLSPTRSLGLRYEKEHWLNQVPFRAWPKPLFEVVVPSSYSFSNYALPIPLDCSEYMVNNKGIMGMILRYGKWFLGGCQDLQKLYMKCASIDFVCLYRKSKVRKENFEI